MRKPAPIAEPLFADPASVLQTQAWKQHFGEQGDYYEQVLRWTDPFHARYGMEEPPTKYRKKGLIAYADGAVGGWNPGEGAGEYWWNSSAWKKIPRIGETATTTLDPSWIPAATVPVAPIWDKIISGAAVTSVTTDGEVTLDGKAHGGYEFEFVIYNPTAGSVTYSFFVNNDTTPANYTREEIRGSGGTLLSGGASDGLLIGTSLAAGNRYVFNGSITIDPAGYVSASHLVHQYATQLLSCCGLSKNVAVANLTRIDIVSSVANGIGINSRFRLWRRK